MNPAVVVSAYNRPRALSRLLQSVARADYPAGTVIPLVISVDSARDHPEVIHVAQQFDWERGPKEIIPRSGHLGPIGHFYACGALTQDFGAIIFLEDDLVVSPMYYHYGAQALAASAFEPCAGGVSLYSLWFNGYTQQPFLPILEDADAFYLQVPYTQGLAFTAQQWSGFRGWTERADPGPIENQPLHEAWAHFKADEWFPWMTRYLVATGKYFLFPRTSLATGFGDAGTHFERDTAFFQAVLERSKRDYRINPLRDTLAVYDSFFELLPERMDLLAPDLAGYEYCVDLYATRTRENIRAPYTLTTRPCRHPLRTYGRVMWPMEANLEYQVPGNGINFCKTQDLRWDWRADLIQSRQSADYFNRGRRNGLKAWLKSILPVLSS